MTASPKVGFTCSYTPLALVHAAGYDPYRILPTGDPPAQSGALLHDNLCPEVLRVLDRRLAGELPAMAAVVLVNSCDAMRRLADAWITLDGAEPVFLLDLPPSANATSRRYLTAQLGRLRSWLAARSGRPISDPALAHSVRLYDRLAVLGGELDRAAAAGRLAGGRSTFQRWMQRLATDSPEATVEALHRLLSRLGEHPVESGGVPILVFGNVLPDPQAMELFACCGARVVADDLCTGSRQLTTVGEGSPERLEERLAAALLGRPLCARTLRPNDADALAHQILERLRGSGARGAVAHVAKFCDPYLLRLPALRQVFRRAGVPLLVLEGDATLRTLGQQRTRIEAFVEMLQDRA